MDRELTNEQVDANIMTRLQDGPRKFVSLRSCGDYRQVDRRLQALKRAGKIRFDTKLGWSAAK